MKYKIYKIIIVILFIIAIILLGSIIYKYQQRQANEKESKKEFEQQQDNNEKNNENLQDNASEKNDTKENTKIKMYGYEVIGTIKIPKIGIEYPILSIETSNPEKTKEPLKFSVVRYWGGEVNQLGNLSIAGHNNYDGTMFGKTKNLEVGDNVELKDLNNQTITYQIYHKFVTNPKEYLIEGQNKTYLDVTKFEKDVDIEVEYMV
mgnify:CR=1 FL=1